MTTAARLLAQLNVHRCDARKPADVGTHVHRCQWVTTATHPEHALHSCGCGDLFDLEPEGPADA